MLEAEWKKLQEHLQKVNKTEFLQHGDLHWENILYNEEDGVSFYISTSSEGGVK